MLELPPFSLVSVEDTRCDRLKGQCKVSSRVDFDNDRVLSALLEACIKRDGTQSLEGHQESGNLEFDLSLLQLSLKLGIPTDQLSQILYEHQCSGRIIYAMTELCLYVRVTPPDLCRLDSISTARDIDLWIWDTTRTLHKQHLSRCGDTSKKLLDMWRLGLVIASHNHVDVGQETKSSASTDQVSIRGRSNDEVGGLLSAVDGCERQRNLMFFINHYMEVMSCSPSFENEPQLPMQPLTADETHYLTLLRSQFDQIPLPFAIQNKYTRQDDDSNSSANRVVRSLAVLLRDPTIGEIINGFSQVCQLDLHSPENRRMKSNAMILYAIRVLLGLSSVKIQSSEWKGRAGWQMGTLATFEFLWSSGEFLLNQKNIDS